MKKTNDIDFLDSYWIEAKQIAKRIKKELPILTKENHFKKSGLLTIVKFSDIKDSWHPRDIIYDRNGKSLSLEALADKIEYMILRGRAESVKRMVVAISTGRVKKIVKGKGGLSSKNETLGYGSFRSQNKVYTLNELEIKKLKEYFKL